MRLTVIIAALGLGACTTTPAMQAALAPLTGQPVERVVAQLGPPTSATPAGADTVYLWHRAKTVHGGPMRATTTGAPAEPTPAYAGPPVPYTCDVRIVADSDGRIKESQFDEQTGGCRESARSLNQLAWAEPR
jgi:hypothetical protein